MKVEFLGSGGAVPTPRPGCCCRVCAEARMRGIPYARSGPSVFVHGPNLLIDTPEESREQLNRSQVAAIDGATYSHWHPDHVLGRRVWESLNCDWVHWPPEPRQTPIYLPQQVAADFKKTLGSWEQFSFLQHRGFVKIIELNDGETFTLNDWTIKPFRLAETYVYGFLIEGQDKRCLICPDETIGWRPAKETIGVDLAVLPMGIADPHPLTGKQIIPPDHPVLKSECSHREAMEIVRALRAKKTILTHIEEPDQCSHDDLIELAKRYRQYGIDLEFAFDTMVADV